MKKLALTSALIVLTAGTAFANTYSITVTNNLSDELLAPIVVTSAENDNHFFDGQYVTPAAEEQVLSGDPAMVVASIGADHTAVGHGTDGPPGVLLAAGKSITFDFKTEATALRIFSMVAPTKVPDQYVSNVVDIHGTDSVKVMLNRFDIGHDEGTKVNQRIADNVTTVMITRK